MTFTRQTCFVGLGLFCLGSCLPPSTIRGGAPEEQQKLPPLVVGSDAPLLLGGSDDRPAAQSPSVAENDACYVCHANYQAEPLVKWHAAGDVGCVDCHGKSFAHRNDENNTTPPDIMFPRGKIDESCQECHETHDVPATEVIARLQLRVPRRSDGERVECTQCHGEHRLPHRTVVWDRATGKLLTGSNEPLPGASKPTLEPLRRLAGNWIQPAGQGEATGKVTATYRVTAAGTAVIETFYPGSEREIVTVYHQDGDRLLLTHYGAARNQPRLECVSVAAPETLVFQFVDATNMSSHTELHVRAVTLRLLAPDHIQIDWQSYDQGRTGPLVTFDLVRPR